MTVSELDDSQMKLIAELNALIAGAKAQIGQVMDLALGGGATDLAHNGFVMLGMAATKVEDLRDVIEQIQQSVMA